MMTMRQAVEEGLNWSGYAKDGDEDELNCQSGPPGYGSRCRSGTGGSSQSGSGVVAAGEGSPAKQSIGGPSTRRTTNVSSYPASRA